MRQEEKRINKTQSRETETNNQNSEMLTATMFPVVSVNNKPTQVLRNVCECVYAVAHTCVALRLWGSLAPLEAVLWETDPTLVGLFSRRGDPLRFHSEPTSYLGGGSSSRFGGRPPGNVRFLGSRCLWKHGVNQRQREEDTRGENQGGVRGAQPAQDMAATAWG